MKCLFFVFLIFFTDANAKDCKYPNDPINWVLRYCGDVIQTDDEITIQDSACFKATRKDLEDKDKCKIKEKYKLWLCEKFLMKNKRYKSIQDCLNDNEVKPFFPGG